MEFNQIWQIIFDVLPMLLPTSEGRARRQRARRFREIKRLRKKRDKGKINAIQYEESLKEIERKYQNL